MQPYTVDSTCVKCGWFHEPKIKYQQGILAPFKEYLQRKCKGCGYTWREMPMDKTEEYYDKRSD